MKEAGWIRKTHRWLSVILTIAVFINIAAIAMQSDAMWVGFLALVPLMLMLFSGWYLFLVPYLRKNRKEG